MAASIRKPSIAYLICLLHISTLAASHIRKTNQMLLSSNNEIIYNDSKHLTDNKNSDWIVKEPVLNFTTLSYINLDEKRDSADFDSIYGTSESSESDEVSNLSKNSTNVETSLEISSNECGDKCFSHESLESESNDTVNTNKPQMLEHDIKLLNQSSTNNYRHTKYLEILRNISIKESPSLKPNYDQQNNSYTGSWDVSNAENISQISLSAMPMTTEASPENIVTKVAAISYSAVKRSLENFRQRGRGSSSSRNRPANRVSRVGLPPSDWPSNLLDKPKTKDSLSTSFVTESSSSTPFLATTESSSSTPFLATTESSSSTPFLATTEISLSSIEDTGSGSAKLTEEEIAEYVNQMRAGRAAVVFNNLDNDVDRCETSTGTRGVCTHLMKCEEILNNLRNRNPVICRWINDMPVVCCPQSIGSRTLNTLACGVRPMPNGMSRGGRRQVNRQSRMPAEFFVSTPAPENKTNLVVGGKESVLGAWPWMAGIYTMNFNIENFFCGAAILNEYYLVTAAHCFNTRGRGARVPAARYAIRVGSNRVKEGTQHLIDEITIHPDYIPREYYNDIAVIRLKEPLEFGNTVQPICLPISQDFRRRLVGRNVTVVGWGDLDFGGKRAEFLRDVTVQIVDLNVCDQAYSDKRGSSIPRGITRQFLCAGAQEGGKDACQRDSGGPLMMNERNVWFLIGVVSFGFRCGEPGVPGVYTRTTHFLDWLQNNTAIN